MRTGRGNPFRARSASWFADQIDEALEVWIGRRFRYANDRQPKAVRDLFRQGRQRYMDLCRGG